VAYTPDWEPIADALRRVMATGVSEDEAKLDLCRAMADRKIDVQVRIAQNADSFRGKAFSGRNVEVPRHPSPDDFDWSRSCPLKPWPIVPVGPQHYTWPGGWRDRPIDLIELSTSDVSRILCGSLSNDTDKKGACLTTVKTIDRETKAIPDLASHLRENPNLKRKEAATWCKKQGFTFSDRGFQYRVWPEARERAGLLRRAPPGRKKNRRI
jgi:hypothetical protein